MSRSHNYDILKTHVTLRMTHVCRCLGVIVVGPSGSGKSSIIEAVVDARNTGNVNLDSSGNVGFSVDSQHKLLKIYPLATDDLTLIFGNVDAEGKWIDGIFTAAWKKAARVC